MYAIVIGVSEFADSSVKRQAGPTRDADAFKGFLLDELGVPQERLTSLQNREATKENIKNALLSLANDPMIDHGDAIIVYYAGQGCNARSPQHFSSQYGGIIQALLPYDFDPASAGEDAGHAILDFELCQYLRTIAEKKGNNIVSTSI